MPGLKVRITTISAALTIVVSGLLSPAQTTQAAPPAPSPEESLPPDVAVSADEPPAPSLPVPTPSVAADATAEANIAAPRPVVWPEAGAATVEVTEVVTEALSLPILVGAGGDPDAPASVEVEVMSPEFARSVGGWGLAFTLTRADDGSVEAPVTVEAVYDGFRHAVGGNFASRLRMQRLPACAIARPQDPTCRAGERVPMQNDLAGGRLVGELMAGVDPAVSPLADAQVDAIYVLRTTASSQFGSYESTSLAPSGEWKAGVNSGEFSWSYDLPVPPTPAGEASPPMLGYSSGSVDGRTSETNPQASWVGLGWELSAGFIERQYRACAEDGHSAWGDLCWFTENATISLNGRTSELIKDVDSGEWRLRDDPNWRVILSTGEPNGDNDGETWQVISPDGTSYYFGRAAEPGSAQPLNATWTVPVFGDADEPCAAEPEGWCDQAWRWNLSLVVDPHENMDTYFYEKEINHYGRNSSPGLPTDYVRGGWLVGIDFGQRVDTGSLPGPGRLEFGVTERCVEMTACPPVDDENAASYPDVPVDMICDGSYCADQYSPTFFTTKRLAVIESSTPAAEGFQDLDWIIPGFQCPDADLAHDDDPSLWLSSLSRSGRVGTPVALPSVVFGGVALENRVDYELSEGVWPMSMFRVHRVTTEMGGEVRAVYGQVSRCARTDQPDPANNTADCYPVYNVPEFGPAGFGWYHKYLALRVDVDERVSGSPVRSTLYAYGGGAAWALDDNPVTPETQRARYDYRGYSSVTITEGVGAVRTRRSYLYFRGMNGDPLPGGTLRNVIVTDSDGATFADEKWLAGRVLESYSIATSGATIDRDNSVYTWIDTAYASADRVARIVLEELHTTKVVVDGAAQPRSLQTVRSYNEYGAPVTVHERGDLANPGDDRCTVTAYTHNTAAWLMNFPAESALHVGGCAGELAARAVTYYDGHGGLLDPPVRGDPTQVSRQDGTRWVDSYAAYDALGRVISATDPNGGVTTTDYVPDTGLTDATTVTNALGHTNSTAYEQSRRLPSVTTDPNGHQTTSAYDALGRLTSVWLPTESTSGPASWTFGYTVSNAVPSRVHTAQLQDVGSSPGYLHSYQYLDGFGQSRETQSPSPIGVGRVVTATRYDDRRLVAAQTEPVYMDGAAGSSFGNPDPLGVASETRFGYDALGREIVSALYSLGAEQWRTATAHFGDRYTVTPPTPPGEAPTTMASTYHLDGYGRTEALVEHFSPTEEWTTNYAYTIRDELASITDTAGNVTTYGFDWLGQRVASDDPNSGAWTYGYDLAGNLTSTVDARGQVLVTGYDALHRRTEVRADSDSGSLLSAWSYDGAGRKGLLSSSSSFTGGDEYEIEVTGYDARNRPLGRTWTVPSGEGALAGSYTVGYGYDKANHATSISFPAAAGLPAETVTTGFDGNGYVTSTTGADQYVASTTYKRHGALAGRTYGGSPAMSRAYTYERATRWLETVTTTVGTSQVQAATYSYAPTGDITQVSELQTAVADRECFGYDAARRLVSAWSGCVREEPDPPSFDEPDPYHVNYSYSPIGQLTEVDDVFADEVWAYDYPMSGANSVRPHAVGAIGGGAGGELGLASSSYAYNGNGNMTRRTVDGEVTELRWNAQNRLNRMLGAQAQRYVYDADGTRLVRRSDTQTKLYLDGMELHLAGTAVEATRYYTSAGATVGIRTPTVLTRTAADHQGSAQVSVQDTDDRVVVARSRYLPYGAARTAPSLPTDRRFLQAPHDDTGLVHLGARFYDAAIGRFISPDPLLVPLDAATLDPYAYAQNNPITFSDPTGLLIDPGEGGGIWVPPTPPDEPNAPVFHGQTPDNPAEFGNEWVAAAQDLARNHNINDRFSWTLVDHLQVSLDACRVSMTACGGDFHDYLGEWFLWANTKDYARGLAGAFAMRDQLPKDLRVGSNALLGVKVYVGTNEDNKISYVGVSNDPDRRSLEHRGTKGEITAVAGPVTRGEARAIEEAIIVRAGGPLANEKTFMNLRHSISEKRPYYSAAVSGDLPT